MTALSEPIIKIYQELALFVRQHLQHDGRIQSAIPALGFYRHNQPFHELPCVQPLGLVLAVQGSKELSFGKQKVHYGIGKGLFIGANIAGFSYMPNCNQEQPFLGIIIDFELSELLAIASELYADCQQLEHAGGDEDRLDNAKIFTVITLSEALLQSVQKFVRCLSEPESIRMKLAQLARREVMLRLLAENPRLCRALVSGSAISKIIHIMAWLRQHFREKLNMDQLATMATMSPSSFRQHFSALTGLSPLQYQKQLRLQEARSLIHNTNCPASTAAMEVGYESVSQFSREYRRFFGVSPSKDK